MAAVACFDPGTPAFDKHGWIFGLFLVLALMGFARRCGMPESPGTVKHVSYAIRCSLRWMVYNAFAD